MHVTNFTCDQLMCITIEYMYTGHVHNSVKAMAKKHRKELKKVIEPSCGDDQQVI